VGELLARFGAGDERLLERVLARSSTAETFRGPDRVVVDAHVAARRSGFAELARQAGVPLLVDPQTHYLQDVQYPDFPWACLPFGDANLNTPSDLSSSIRQDRLVATCVDFQLSCGATAVIPPYVHVERASDGWLDVQAGLWRRTRNHLDGQNLTLPVVPVLAVGWRLLDPSNWPEGIDRLQAPLAELAPEQIAIAASKVDQGRHADQRLQGLISTIRHLRRRAPVLAWQQGALGEAAVAGGAIGYETGLGWRERCDLGVAMSQYRAPRPSDGGFGARPVYVATLARSIPKPSVRALQGTPVSPHLVCLDFDCCPDAAASLLGDARAHALQSRTRRLGELGSIANSAWRWNWLAENSQRGIDLGTRINRLARTDRFPSIARIDLGALHATHAVAEYRRLLRGGRRAA
jgi:hypothetical protein